MRPATGRKCARIDDLITLQHDLATPFHHAVGAHCAAVVDYRGQQRIGRAGGHHHHAAVRLDDAAVGDLSLVRRLVHLDRHQAVRVKTKRDIITSRQAGCPFVGDDRTGVLDRIAEQRDKAASYISLIND